MIAPSLPAPSRPSSRGRSLLIPWLRPVAIALAWLAGWLAPPAAHALTGGPDAFGYTFTDTVSGGVSYNFENISATGTTAATVSNTQDAIENVPVGFTFTYYGNAYTTCTLATHGYIGFNNFGGVPIAQFTNNPMPTAGGVNEIIAGWWDDLNPAVAGTIYYQTLGTAPNRRFIVQYDGVALSDFATTTTFQFKLFEGTNRIEVHYSSVPAVGTSTMGIENANGTVGLQYFNGGGLPPIGAGPFAVAYVAQVTVTNASDSGAGSLRQALTSVPVGGTINFVPALNGQTISLTTGTLTIAKSLSIDASGLASGLTVASNGTFRVFTVNSGHQVTIDRLTITGGGNGTGGGIHNQSALGLSRCTVSGNQTGGGGWGGGVYNGGTGTLTATNCTFANNNAEFGGGLFSDGITNLNHLTVAGNSANTNAGGIWMNFGTTTIHNSIFSNTSPGAPDVVQASEATYIQTGTNLIGGSPQLAPLANYGGPTATRPPLSTSPAVNAATGASPGEDQRGIARPIGAAADIGAVEGNYNLVITSINDAGAGSLRDTLAFAIPGTTITFSPLLGGGLITLGGSQLTISRNVIIDATSLSNGLTITGNNASRVFHVTAGSEVTLSHLTITGGNGSGGGGGGILNQGTLTLNRSTVSGNTSPAGNWGGGIYNAAGTLTTSQCTFANNRAEYGGGVFSDGTATLNQTTISANRADTGGGGLWRNGGTVTIQQTIISGNSSPLAPEEGNGVNQTGLNLIGGNARLAPLGRYGGAYQTMPPLASSSAINPAGGPTTSPLATDQRGYTRVIGGIVDLGAVEAGPAITVSNVADTGAGSLRQALADATTPGHRILFAPALSGATITLTSGQLSLPGSAVVTIDGTNLANGISISGNNASRVFSVGGGTNLNVAGLTITGGRSLGGGPSGEGAAFHNFGTLTVNACTLTGNTSLGNGGAIANFAVARVHGSTFTANTASATGGAIFDFFGNFLLSDSTISGNTASGSGGGIALNSSIATLRNNIIAANFAASNVDIHKVSGGTLTPAGANLIGDNSSVAAEFSASTLVGTTAAPKAPLLRALASRGGPTQTLALRPGSPAIDAAGIVAGAPATDQRARARDADGDANGSQLPDLGAYEVGVTVVTSTANSGAGTLRSAIDANAGHEWITFDPGVFNGTPAADIVLASQLAVTNQDLHFQTPNSGGGGVTLNGNGATRVLHVQSGSTVEMDRVAIVNGFITGSQNGAAILNNGTLTLRQCTLARNVSGQYGGAIGNTSTLTLTNCTVTDNRAAFDGGGGIDMDGGSASLTNCTISGNASLDGGGIWATGGAVILANTIVAGNRAITGTDIRGPISAASTGGNLIGDGSNMSGLAHGVNGNQVGTGSLPIDPRLAPLARYGGALETQSLLVGSPAVNAGLIDGPATDQRGFARIGQPDIGALEAGPMLIVTNTGNSGGGSLRQQIASATTAGTRIVFNLPSNSTIGLTGSELLVETGRTIFIDASTLVNGAGNPTTEPDPLRPGATIIPRGVTVSANNLSRVFQISGGSTLGLQRLELTGGNGTSNGGGMVNFGTLTMTDSTIRNSTTTYRGGGLSNFSHAALIRCTVHNNHANDIGAGIENVNFLSLDRCTISSNDTPSVGGGIFNFSRMSLRHSTISANAAFSGGGFVTQDSIVELENTVIAGNIGDAVGADLGSGGNNTIVTRGGNLIGNHGAFAANFPAGLPNANGDRVGSPASPIAALLGPLALNGGPTRTMLPIPNSPAIDNADATGFVTFTDQRGFARALAGGPDIGAVETAAGNFSPGGLTLYAEVPPAIGGAGTMFFQISTDADFFPTATTLAGTGTVGAANGAALSSQFAYPSDIAEDAGGDRFIADSGNNRIRMLDTDGQVTTIAGTGSFGHVDGDGAQASFAFPAGIAVGPDGHVYVSDTLNHCIRKLTRPEAPGLPWVVSTIAGDGTSGFLDGIGTAARLNHPHALTLDRAGNLYVADTNNHRIRKITPDGVVSTYAGTGTAGATEGNRMIAKFSSPFGVTIDVTDIASGQAGGVLFIADSGNHRIRRIGTNDEVSTIAGGTLGFLNGNGTAARFNSPSGVAVDAVGDVVVADRANHSIRKVAKPINPLDPWVTSTLAGTGVAGFVNGRTTSTGARFNTPTGVHVAADGKILVADHFNHRLRIIAEPLLIQATLTGTGRFGSAFLANVNASALGLVPETTYYFRWLAADGSTNPIGEFFTLVPIPTVVTTDATDVTRFSAVVNGLVDPNGSPTVVTFDYSTDPDLLGPLMVSTLVNGLEDAGGMDVDAATGNTYLAVRSTHRIMKVTPAGAISVFAGSGTPGSADGTGILAQFDHPVDVALDVLGNVYVAEELGQRIRKITPGGEVTTLAGSGVAGFADDSTATAGKFLFPSGVAVTPDGTTVYVADRGNHRIRVITGGALATLAGDGIAGFGDGPAATARFQSPTGVAVDATGNVFVADRDNHRIRVVNASDEVITFAGSGAAGFIDDIGPAAEFSSPSDLDFDGGGILHVCDRDNHRLRTIDPAGVVTTRAGSGIDGVLDSPGAAALWPATATRFSGPRHLAVHPSADLVLVTESGSERLRRIARGSPLSVMLPGSYSSNGDLALGITLPKTLVADATYYFRVRGTNPQGTAIGKILSFTTSDEPQIEVSMPGISTLSHDQDDVVDFGITPLGTPVTRQFTITNNGGWLLTIHSITAPIGYVIGGVISDVIPGESLTFEVTLLATGGGNFSGNLEIESDDPGQGTFTFPLTGIVRDPPGVTTLAATEVTATAATLNAMVNPEDSETTVWFEYGTDPDFDGVVVSTVAGGTTGYAEGTGTAASFNLPRGLATDEVGNVYVADTNNHRIRMIAPDGTTSTIAGTGVPGFADGPVGTAQFNSPAGLVRGPDGTLFVADSDNHRIRAITPGGEVTTYSGLGEAGFTDGVALAARFNHPQGLAMDASGILYVADRDNHRVRKVALNGDVTTLAGTGLPGSLNGPLGIATLNGPLGIVSTATGVLYLTENPYHSIRRIDPDGTVTLVAGQSPVSGFADATGLAARFSSPAGLVFDHAGHLVIADRGNHRLRRMTEAGVVTTLAGTGTSGGTDGTGETAKFNQPYALARGPDGELIAAEAGTSTIRQIAPTRVLVEAADGLTGTTDLPVSASITGLIPGLTYYFRAIATNVGGTTIGNTLSTGGSPFLLWQVAEFGPDAGNPLIAGPDANPSGDGIPNVIKYALGLDPHVPTLTGLPVVAVTGGDLTLTYTEVTGATDIDYIVEWSTDLFAWSDAGVTDEVVTPGTITRLIKASIARGTDQRKFIRLNVTLQQP